MSLHRLARLAVATAFAIAASAVAQDYPVDAVVDLTDSLPGWDGHREFPGVYCLQVPDHADVAQAMEVSMKGNAIDMVRYAYDETTMANIVVSTMPPDRDREQEIEMLEQHARANASAQPASFRVARTTVDGIERVEQRVVNIHPGGVDPFPVALNLFVPDDGRVHSMSVHRLFVGNWDRFEVAVFRKYEPARDAAETEALAADLSLLADRYVSAIGECTRGPQWHFDFGSVTTSP